MRTVLSAFTDRDAAHKAAADLRTAGLTPARSTSAFAGKATIPRSAIRSTRP